MNHPCCFFQGVDLLKVFLIQKISAPVQNPTPEKIQDQEDGEIPVGQKTQWNVQQDAEQSQSLYLAPVVPDYFLNLRGSASVRGVRVAPKSRCCCGLAAAIKA